MGRFVKFVLKKKRLVELTGSLLLDHVGKFSFFQFIEEIADFTFFDCFTISGPFHCGAWHTTDYMIFEISVSNKAA